MTKSIEQLQAEAQTAQEELQRKQAELKAEQDELAKRATAEAQRKATELQIAEVRVYAAELVALLQKAGVKCSVKEVEPNAPGTFHSQLFLVFNLQAKTITIFCHCALRNGAGRAIESR